MTTSKSTEAVLGTVLAINLRRLMKAQDLSREGLALKSGRELTSVDHALNGESEKVTVEDLEAFAAALGVLAMDLLNARSQGV